VSRSWKGPAAPDDDLPRLVYADALEERGDLKRADFIRVQIELARDPGRLDLRAREAALLAVHGIDWLYPLLWLAPPSVNNAGVQHRTMHGKFVRGFVEILWMPASGFVCGAGRLFRLSPVRELRVLRTLDYEWQSLLRCEYLGRLSTLDVSERLLGDAGVAELAESKYVAGLRVVRLRACNLSDVGADALTRMAVGERIDELDVSLNDLSPSALAALRIRFGERTIRFDPPPPIGSTPAPPGR
jgi:uncharacterized protein (TIGR02996 family)